MAYKTPEILMEDFKRDWEAALNPDVTFFEMCCHPEMREEFLRQVDEYLEWAPSPPYSPVQLRRIAEKVDPIIERAMQSDEYRESVRQSEERWKALPWYVRRYRRTKWFFQKRMWWWRARRTPKPWE